MIILEVIILLIGLSISLLSLPKKDSKRKNTSKRVLAFFYISLFIISIIVIIIKSQEVEESGLKLFKSLNSIEKVITTQSDTLITLIDSINAIKVRMDNIVRKTEEAIIQREQSQKIFDEQNRLLEKSNDLTQKQFEDSKPDVITYTGDITFAANDSISTKTTIVFRNEGKRVASEFKTNYALAFKTKIDSKYSYKFFSSSNSKQSDIYPTDPIVGLTLTDEFPIPFDTILRNSTEGLIIISIRYIDKLFNNVIEKKLIFRLQIDKERIKVFKENTIPKELEEDMLQNKINLNF